MKRLFLLCFVFMLCGQVDVNAQTDDPPGFVPQVLLTGVDVNGNGFPIALLDIASQQTQTLATFANRPVCLPAMYPDGSGLLYELLDLSGQAYVYRIDVDSGDRNLVLAPSAEMILTCPQVSPDGNSVLWQRANADGTTTLLTTSADLTEPYEVVTQPNIYDAQWSPGGGALVYHAIDETTPFPTLYSVPRQGAVSPREVFAPRNGLLEDYVWLPDGTGLVVAYYTDENLALAVLSATCVIGPGDFCQAEPFVTFPFTTSITLTDAYAAERRQLLVVLRSGANNAMRTDLFAIHIDGSMSPQQLTDSPQVIESDAHWLNDASGVYFIGSTFDDINQQLRGAVYYIELNSDAPPVVMFESTVFSPAQFLWWYD